MKKSGVNRVWMAWLLAALLILPVAARTIHVFEEEHAAAEDSHPSHDCDNCPVCQFALGVFTATEPLSCDPVVTARPEPETSLSDRPYAPVRLPYGLRAPPAIPFPVH